MSLSTLAPELLLLIAGYLPLAAISALSQASKHHHHHLVVLIRQYLVDNVDSIIRWAISSVHIPTLQLALSISDCTQIENTTSVCNLICLATCQPNVEVVETLFSHFDVSADVICRRCEYLPLQRAIMCDHPSILSFLLQHGANPHLHSRVALHPNSLLNLRHPIRGNSAILAAARSDGVDVLRLLIAAGVDVVTLPWEEPLSVAVVYANWPWVRVWVEAGGSCPLSDWPGYTKELVDSFLKTAEKGDQRPFLGEWPGVPEEWVDQQEIG